MEVACSLACIVLGNNENQERLKETPAFNYNTLLSLLKVKNEVGMLITCVHVSVRKFNVHVLSLFV